MREAWPCTTARPSNPAGRLPPSILPFTSLSLPPSSRAALPVLAAGCSEKRLTGVQNGTTLSSRQVSFVITQAARGDAARLRSPSRTIPGLPQSGAKRPLSDEGCPASSICCSSRRHTPRRLVPRSLPFLSLLLLRLSSPQGALIRLFHQLASLSVASAICPPSPLSPPLSQSRPAHTHVTL